MRVSLLAIILFLVISDVYSQKYSNEFLNIGVGAKAHAMGHAQTAIVDDVTAGYWNPAGLEVKGTEMQLAAMHAEWFAGIGKYDYLALSKPLKKEGRTVGLSIIRLGIDNIPNTLNLFEDDGTINYSNVSPFSAADYAFLLSYSQGIVNDKLRIGGNTKIIYRKIGPFASAWGFGLDIGLNYKIKSWKFAFVAKDVTTTFNAWRFNFTEEEKQVLALTDNTVPESSIELTRPQFILGLGFEQQWGKFGLQAALDLTTTTDGQRNTLISAKPLSIDPVVGLELNYSQFIYLRGGINGLQELVDLNNTPYWSFKPNAGIGLKIGKVRIDYAFSNITGDNSYSHIISLLVDLNFDYIRKAMRNAS